MKILSLFDGISCGQLSLPCLRDYTYYASEIDSYAKKVTYSWFPDTIDLGDVNNYNNWDIPWEYIDLLIAGSPCQGFSNAGQGENFKHKESELFFTFLSIKNKLLQENPKAIFLLENVTMKAEWENKISELVGCSPVLINSELVSAQNRSRNYWSNKKINIPIAKDNCLKDILDFSLPSDTIGLNILNRLDIDIKDITPKNCRYLKLNKKLGMKTKQNKASCLTAGGNSGGNHSDMDIIVYDNTIRRLTVKEWEKLQTIPVGYTDVGISNSQRYKALGNGWTISVIESIYKDIL